MWDRDEAEALVVDADLGDRFLERRLRAGKGPVQRVERGGVALANGALELFAQLCELTDEILRDRPDAEAIRAPVPRSQEAIETLTTEFKDGQFVTRRHTRGMDMTDRLSVLPFGDGTKVAWSIDYTPPVMLRPSQLYERFMSRPKP